LPDTPDAGVTPPADTGEEIAWGDATRVAAMAIDAEEFIFFWLPLGIISLKDECDELDVDDGAADRYDDAELTGYEEEEEEESTDEWLEPKDTPDVTCMYVCPTSGHLLVPFFLSNATRFAKNSADKVWTTRKQSLSTTRWCFAFVLLVYAAIFVCLLEIFYTHAVLIHF